MQWGTRKQLPTDETCLCAGYDLLQLLGWFILVFSEFGQKTSLDIECCGNLYGGNNTHTTTVSFKTNTAVHSFCGRHSVNSNSKRWQPFFWKIWSFKKIEGPESTKLPFPAPSFLFFMCFLSYVHMGKQNSNYNCGAKLYDGRLHLYCLQIKARYNDTKRKHWASMLSFNGPRYFLLIFSVMQIFISNHIRAHNFGHVDAPSEINVDTDWIPTAASVRMELTSPRETL